MYALLQEVRGVKKTSHWIWYIFPRIVKRRSDTSKYYGIKGRKEAYNRRYSFGVNPIFRLKIRQKWGMSLNPLS